MTGKKCEVCGREIENPTNRQRFCKECAKKSQAEAFHRYYLANREYYAERSKEQSTRRKQSRLEELLAGELQYWDEAYFAGEAKDSLAKQRERERSDSLSFDDFLADYFGTSATTA